MTSSWPSMKCKVYLVQFSRRWSSSNDVAWACPTANVACVTRQTYYPKIMRAARKTRVLYAINYHVAYIRSFHGIFSANQCRLDD